MAGKKGRKRQRAKKKDSQKNINKKSASVEGKKAKLNDELKKQDELSADKREPRLETGDKCNNNTNNGKEDLQEDESKYVPPFSRKLKRNLKRSGSPVSPATKPKRSWRGVKQDSTQVLPKESSAVYTDEDKQCNKDSPKMEKKENKHKEKEEDEDVEDEIDVVGIKPQTYSQEDKNFVVHSTKQTTDKDVNMAKDGVILSPALLIDQEEALSIVRYVLDNVIDAMCKMDHCNSDWTMTAEITTSGEKAIESYDDAYNGSASATVQAVDRHISSSEKTPEIAKFEESCTKNGTSASNCSNETLQSYSKIEVPHGLHDVENEHGLPKRDSDNVCCGQSYTYGSEREDEAPNPKTEHLALISNVKSAVLLCDNMTTNKEELQPISTTQIPSMNTQLMSSEVQSADCKPEKENCHLSKTAEDAETVSETDVDMLMSEDVPGADTHQSLDQMVPACYEPTTILSQTKGKPDQNGIDKCLTSIACLKTPPCLEDEKENQTNKLEENIHSSAPKKGSTRETEECYQEEAQPFDAGKECGIYRDCETGTCKGVNQTVETSVKCSLQGSPTYKQILQKAIDSELWESEKGEALSSIEQAPGCSSFDSQQGDILELDCVMDCTDSQLVHLDSSADQLPPYDKLYTRQVNNSKVSGSSCKSKADVCSVEVPSDNGMIKGLISELSSLNKFIMVAWKDLENQKKQRQARLKSGKGKKLK